MGTYTVLNERAHGGFAKVFIVVDKHGKQFAKKVFSPQKNLIAEVGIEELKRRFIREVKYQSRIHHKNVVPIIESNLEVDPPSFIMPLAVCTLKEEMDAGEIPSSYKKAIFDILAGLEFMHTNGIIHRDLKPANVLKFKNSSDDDFYYAISDFGLLSIQNSDSTTLTGSNVRGGTTFYAAPELLSNFRGATSRADIYSFGAILHDFYGNGAKRIPYSEIKMSGKIGEIVYKCTRSNSMRRYQSVSEIREIIYPIIETSLPDYSSTEEELQVQILENTNELTDQQWDDVFLFLENQDKKLSHCYNIFMAISESHISNCYENSPEIFNGLGIFFSIHISENSFVFDYCDILAHKAEVFYKKGDISLKAKITLALLKLGVSHNRWYVERKFLSFVNSDIDEILANRIVTEIEVDEIDFSNYIHRLQRSIEIQDLNLHTILRKYLKENE